MQQAAIFLNALKRCLKAKGVSYLDIAAKLGISHTSVKRIFSEGTLSLTRVGAILDAFDLTFTEVARLVDKAGADDQGLLTFEQESILAQDSKLFAFFHLLLFGKSPDKIVEEFVLSRPQCERHLRTLLELGLIERRAGGRIKPLSACNVQWRDGGPLRQRYASQIREEFLSGPFTGDREIFTFATRSLAKASQALIKHRIQQLVSDAKEIASIDSVAAPGEAKTCGLMIGFRPYAFSVVKALPRRRRDVTVQP